MAADGQGTSLTSSFVTSTLSRVTRQRQLSGTLGRRANLSRGEFERLRALGLKAFDAGRRG